jgi:hypothetical protein
MKRQDQINETNTNCTKHVKRLRATLRELFHKKIFAHIKQRDTATWKIHILAACAFLWMASNEKNIVDAFNYVRKMLPKMFTTLTTIGISYQGFMDQLGRYNKRMMDIIIPHFQNLTKSKLKNYWLTAGFMLLGVDGSRVQLARTESLKKAFAPKKKKQETKRKYKKRVRRYKKKQTAKDRQKKRESPQIWLTLLWHIGTGLPYNWRIGASDSSEREHAQSMFADLPSEALIVADAGFVGYDFWTSMIESNINFVIRVGGNVTLLRELGWATKERADTVYLWPKSKRDKEPLVLRLIHIHDGKQPLCLVTNLGSNKLSAKAALEVYRRRWGIEVFFRTLKQTFDRRKLRCRSAANAPLELEWSLLALWGMCLIGGECLDKSGVVVSRLSPAKTLKAFAEVIRDYRIDLESREEGLFERLRVALLDDYVRQKPKTNCEYPCKSQKEKIHQPKIEIASKTTKKQAHALKIRATLT